MLLFAASILKIHNNVTGLYFSPGEDTLNAASWRRLVLHSGDCNEANHF